MYPVVIEACVDSAVNFEYEKSVVSLWSESAPQVGDVISMGHETRWEVVEVFQFQPANLGEPISTVYSVFVHPQGLPIPDRNHWTIELFKPDHPIVSLNLKLVDEVIELDFNMQGNPPKIGAFLQSYEQIGETSAMKSHPRDWYVESVSPYLPLNDSPYARVHVCRCERVAMAA